MIIPENVNHLSFYKQIIANHPNITIRSRYIGVYLNINRGKPFWMARIQKNGKLLKYKRFPFTINGEIQAAEYYNDGMEKLGLQQRMTTKRKYS